MKKYLIALSTLLFSLSSNAAFVTLPDGVTPSTDLSVEIQGTAVNYGFSVDDDVFATVQFQLVALDVATDDLNQDGLLTVQFGYLDALGNFLGYDLAGYSVLWTDIIAAQSGASATAELVFSSSFKSVISGPYETSYSLANNVGDYYAFAVLEGLAYVGVEQIYAIDLEIPPVAPPPPGVPAPASLGILALGMLGLLGSRKIRK
ncbi:PEP-CTERM sorting domain-containing protein [Pseudoalteromonas sp.]|uniref:PEP-CTERM sorting domain-containing protein n=1 Tax=Pseudoalteromonas sp. TaxID=53249 RepID=UPI0026021413|nr:PEP-CTERM sorting domain-containing protein [Pseudoalteromonas sp.]MCP4058038.1 hypothetical protein [Pseudoalteromonas sp.]MCP4585079.1 hypothetical protein [Pseudoalteromonas sp.]MCP5077213.1 hypothetical protein [Psychromonas sp.]